MKHCLSILFPSYLLNEGTSSATNAWILNTHRYLWHASHILVRPLGTELGWRNTTLVACLTCSISLVASAFTPSPEMLILFYSVLSGKHSSFVKIFFMVQSVHVTIFHLLKQAAATKKINSRHISACLR